MKIDYQTLFEKSPGLFLVLDINLKIVEASDAYLSATMTEREAIVYKDIFNVFPDNPHDEQADGVYNLKASLERVIQNKVPDRMPIQKYDIRNAKNEFERRYWSALNLPILDINGRLEHILHSVEDVTPLIEAKELEVIQKNENVSLSTLNKSMSLEIYERIRQVDQVNLQLKKMNEVLAEKTRLLELSNEDLTVFAETAAHDIKSPFRSIGGHLEIVSDKMKNRVYDDELVDSLNSIRAARKRIGILLDDLLRFASVTRPAESHGPIDLNLLLPDVVANLEYAIAEKKATVHFPLNMPFVKGTYIEIFQLFQNLIGNAIKFCDTIPRVDVSYTQTDKNVEIAIADNGIGIKEEYYEKIFIPFKRLHGSEKYSGTGLGLAICKRIVDRHNGQIRISSNNKGTTFYFTLQKNEAWI